MTNEKIEKLYFAFPWLYGAKVDDYINIVNRNKLLYENYCTTIMKFTDAVHKGNYSSVKQEMDEANISMRIELVKAQHRLFRKGIQTVVSIAFTFISMMISLPEEQKVALAAFLGTISLKDIMFTFSDEISNIHSIGKESPFWLMYQWHETVKI